ncbi:hypothetical protein [Roseomonas genomospecies 6]|uniref:Uncharacterized protein n=1 Tax=Roseomonas genomospecies 6 TaxID=214106 RepID=A0A9W7KSE9_9PROT|nr:hypothetical protein [Roseomonas genomospecies 6]KAA0678254.1 hypothetical protein DS843_20590 [Roseomonas genomospecies 6]
MFPTTDADDVALMEYDLVYCHHHQLPLLLPERLPDEVSSAPIIIYNHLSPFELFEAPGVVAERLLGRKSYCNSQETLDALKKFDTGTGRWQVLPNPAPDAFWLEERAPCEELTSLVAVSNHPPSEVAELLDRLEARGVRVTRIGFPWSRRRVTPDDLIAHDAVLTIGKTVQYALAARCAVFCYDHFGGPGWLTEENFDRTAHDNFSGRSHRRTATAEALEEEILSGFPEASRFAAGLPEERRTIYRLAPCLAGLVRLAQDPAERQAALARVRHLYASPDLMRDLAVERNYSSLLRREFLAKQHYHDLYHGLLASVKEGGCAEAAAARRRQALLEMLRCEPGIELWRPFWLRGAVADPASTGRQVSAMEDWIQLHPLASGDVQSRLVFAAVPLAGHGTLDCGLALANPHAGVVVFRIAILLPDGRPVLTVEREVGPGETVACSYAFPPVAGTVRIVLETSMHPDAANAGYAWARFVRPTLRLT